MGNRCFRRSEYNEQDNKKWLSDSMTEHDGHRRLLISMLSCLPTSIMSLWLDNFNLVIATLCSTLVTSVKYSSNPMCFFIFP